MDICKPLMATLAEKDPVDLAVIVQLVSPPRELTFETSGHHLII